MRTVAIALVLCGSASALAETRDELQARGEALGREGKWTDAVHAFKAAEKLEHRAIHACLIALAHARREVWPEAALYLSRCHENVAEALPEWVPEAEQLIRQHLAGLAAITIVVEPPTRDVQLTTSSFEPDEEFEPGTIYLPRGTHVIVARSPGRAEQQKVVVVDSSAPQRVEIALVAPLVFDVDRGRTLRLVGLASAVVGVLAGGLGVKFAYDARADAGVVSMHVAGTQWTADEERTFDDGRAKQRGMYVSYIAGGALVITGGVLYYLGARAHTHVEPVVTSRSASLSIAGSF